MKNRPCGPPRGSLMFSVLGALAACMFLPPDLAQAYVGPGAGLTAIGTVLALIGAVLLALAGLIWYPIKSLIRRFSREKPPIHRSGETE